MYDKIKLKNGRDGARPSTHLSIENRMEGRASARPRMLLNIVSGVTVILIVRSHRVLAIHSPLYLLS